MFLRCAGPMHNACKFHANIFSYFRSCKFIPIANLWPRAYKEKKTCLFCKARTFEMFNRQCGAGTHNNSPHNMNLPYPVYENIAQSDITWCRHLFRTDSASFLDLSHNDTEQLANASSGQSCSLDSFQSNSPLALEAQQLWESVSRIREPGTNCSSVCSSASTLASATLCTQPQLSFVSAMEISAAPSFDFMMQRSHFDATGRLPQHAIENVSPFAPWLGAGFPTGPAGQWHSSSLREDVSTQEHVEHRLEEFSLGSGYPG